MVLDVKTYHFLEGGGEMGKLTRNFDWSRTPVGPIEEWPQSLRITLGIVLHSDFPMFLWWGKDMIQFYNDAYRPSLGDNGKHPYALGQPAEDCWPEIWDTIFPLIQRVRTTGQSFFAEDQLIPIFRNGKLEDVYWTFSYSAVIGDSGMIDGVLVICNETTKRMQATSELKKKQLEVEINEKRFKNVIDQVNAGIAQADLDGRFQEVNERFCAMTGYEREELLTMTVGDVTHPDDWERNHVLFEKCRNEGKGFFIEKRYIRKDGSIIWVNNNVSMITSPTGEHLITAVSIDITARKTQEKKIHLLLRREHHAKQDVETERQKMIDLFMQAPAAIAILHGPDHVFELANPRYMELVGVNREIIGKPLRNALPEVEGQGFLELLDRVYNTGKAFSGFEMPINIRRKQSEEKAYLNFVYQPSFSSHGNIEGILVHAVDVTEHVLARKRVEESELRFRTLVNEATVATAVYTGSEMKIELANEAMIRVWGKDDSVIGKSIAEALPELEGQPFLELLNRVYTTGETYWGKEDRADLVVDGELKTAYFNFTYKPLRNSEGIIYGILNMAVDVTDQVLIRQQVEQSESNLRNIILQAPVAMCLLKGINMVVEIANDRMIKLWGTSAKDILNQPIFEGLPQVAGQGFEQILEKVFTTGERFAAYGRPVSLPRRGAVETLYINFVYEAYKDKDGVITGIMAVAYDVTQQIIAQTRIENVVEERTRELAVANQNLQASNAALSQFAYITSHDLQEPARKISTFVEMLNNSLGENVDARSKNYIQKIENSSTRMLTLIRDVLNFSQLGEGRDAFESLDLNDVLQNTKNDFELLIEQKQCTISNNRLPVINAIPVQMSQLFGNLISNALKFCSPVRKPHISIFSEQIEDSELNKYSSLDKNKRYHIISFADNGIGFNQANAVQIFDIFQRLHGKSEYEGTGIGLAICKKIIDNHGGEIYATGIAGEGATFVIILPE